MNSRLIAGLALLAALVALSMLGPHIEPFTLDYSESLRIEQRHGESTVYFAPESPNSRHPLGTDRYGFDLMTGLLRGLPATLGIVLGAALLRSALAFLSALVAASLGLRHGAARSFSPLAALPTFIIAYFILYPLTIDPLLPAWLLFAIQGLVITLLDLPALARSFAAKGEAIAARSFVSAARASGGGSFWIARRHIAPFLVDELIESVPIQAVSVAAFVAKLGVFGLFMGGTILQRDVSDAATILLSTSRELVGLLGQNYRYFPGYWWLFVPPFAAWLLVLACVELIASGLHRLKGEREGRLYSALPEPSSNSPDPQPGDRTSQPVARGADVV